MGEQSFREREMETRLMHVATTHMWSDSEATVLYTLGVPPKWLEVGIGKKEWEVLCPCCAICAVWDIEGCK
jgi:hypothetical protein